MAAASGRTDPSVADRLFAEGYRFGFFQAVRVLERLSPDREPVGEDAKPHREVARFRARQVLEFPASEIYEVNPAAEEGRPPEMTVAFMGLTGPLGVLPRHYTELIIERTRRKDHTLREFLDLFNHRFISLFFRAWQKYRFFVGYERALASQAGYDPFSLCLFDLIGMGTKGLRGRLQIEDETLLFYAGLLAQNPRSASALEGILEDYFGAPARAAQFVGQWLFLAEDQRTRLGLGEANSVIGVNAVIGSRVWDQQAKFEMRVGPLTYDRFCGFLPSGDAFRPLAQLIRFFVGQEFDFDVRLVLRAAEVPGCRLGGGRERAVRLGWSTWLKTADFARDAEDTLITGRLTQVGALPG
jgi:type VI secretion system protein ImpH